MDLHLINTGSGGALWNNALDCYFGDCRPTATPLDWGTVGDTSDNPQLIQDNIASTVPEMIDIADASPGTYSPWMHFYGDHGVGPGGVDATVTVTYGGVEIYQKSAHFSAVNQTFDTADITLAPTTSSINPVEQYGTTTPM